MSDPNKDKPNPSEGPPLPEGWTRMEVGKPEPEQPWPMRLLKGCGVFLLWSFVAIGLLFGTCLLLLR